MMILEVAMVPSHSNYAPTVLAVGLLLSALKLALIPFDYFLRVGTPFFGPN